MRIIRDKGLVVCDHCGHQQETAAVSEDLDVLSESSHMCPVCATPLSHARLHGHPVLACGRCAGLLIEMNRFGRLIESVRANDVGSFRTSMPRQQQPGARTLPCPLCANPLLNHQYAGPGNVVLDSCERCLVNWLDQGELRRIALAPDTKR
jgi:Zn-finger nucleic acid-binding protein